MPGYDWRQNLAGADFADWFTVAAYGLAIAAAMVAARGARAHERTQDGLFWHFVALALGFLAANELLDLQTLLTALGKQAALNEGWYDQRRVVQMWFILALLIGALLGGAAIVWLTRRSQAAIRLAIGGLAFIAVFVLVRAASFHHTDEWLGRDLSLIDYGTAQEVTGIALVAFAAVLYRRALARSAPPQASGSSGR
ncbi:hypothetical protein [Porphyrobacter sp. GA68]|uniref:hypothetical protein n=1 Tax=Porphyrobacter sp. GA68 TaxID=2883480 RepID=UPI001D1905EE|nr:hypothetical protein [Porphyrobacter sp. GA68]